MNELSTTFLQILKTHYGCGPGVTCQPHAQGTSSEAWRVQEPGSEKSFCLRFCDEAKRAAPLYPELMWRDALRSIGGCVVPRLVRTVSGELLVPVSDSSSGFVILEEFIATDRSFEFPPTRGAQDITVAAGAVLANIHQAGEVCRQRGALVPLAPGFPLDMPDPFAANHPTLPSLQAVWPEVSARWSAVSPGLPQVVIHGDFHPGNCAWRKGTCVGVFDFEYARLDVRLLDLAYAMLFFCVDWGSSHPTVVDSSASTLIQAYELAGGAADETGAGVTTLLDSERSALGDATRFVAAGCWLWAISTSSEAQSQSAAHFIQGCQRIAIGA